MMRPRIQFENSFLESWEELYLLADEWKSDMEFYNYELRFITNTINKNFLQLIKNGNIATVQNNIKKLSSANHQHKKIMIKLNNHLVRLEELMMNPFLPDDQLFRDEHLKLENQFYAFERQFKTIKKETFSISEPTIEEENLNYRLAF